jgi:hypothetical protein
MRCAYISRLSRRFLPVLLVAIGGLLVTADLSAATVTQIENAKPGSTDWQLTNPATNHEIEGYASLASVNRGSQVSFFVNTTDPTFTLDVFRMGWYAGAGARRMMSPVQLTGTKQTIPAPDPITGIVECQWTNPYTLAIPFSSDQTNWASGVYLARLTGNTSGKQSFIIFVVRDDSRISKYLYQLSTNTFQAYNNWGGKSLYTWNSTNSIAAVNVSFNRPYALGNQPTAAPGVGAGEFLTDVQPASETLPGGWGYNMVRFLEREGYDVSYISDVDAHENGSLLLSSKALLVVGHSEYWSWQMRTNVQAARDSGVGIGFFSSNTCYWQIRFGPSAVTGAADRTIIAYKSSTADPYASNPSTAYLTTTLWRSSPVNLPEDAFVGVMYAIDHVNGDIIVSNASHWVYTFTGLKNGDHLPGILGYEIDDMQGHQPATTVGVAHEITPTGIPADSTVYTAASGATVFATGSFQWNWGLDDYNVPNIRPSVINSGTQQVTRNVLARLAGDVFSPAFSIIPSPRIQAINTGTSTSYTITTTAFGYTPTITLSLAGLPANVPYTFTPATFTGSGSSTLTISPNASSSTGIFLLTISGSDGIQTRTESVSLSISNPVPKNNWKLVYADSQETQCENGAAVNGFDANATTIWHTQYCPSTAQLPHEIQIDMGAGYLINGFRYLPRQDSGVNGRIGQYEFYATNNLSSWGTPLATGGFANDTTEKQVQFAQNTYRYIRLRALTEANGGPWTSMAELKALQATGGAPSLLSMAVTPSNPTIIVGGAQQFTATRTYQGGGTQDITSQVNWTSSAPVATISTGGLATGQSTGNTTVTAGLSGITASTSLTVQAASGSLSAVSKTGWKLVYADSQETQCENGAAVNGFDGGAATMWHTQYCPRVSQLPHEIQIDMGNGYVLGGFRYLPRQDGGTHGRIGQYEFYATNNLSNWGTPLATGTFANDATEKQVLLSQNSYRYIRLRALTEANGGPWTSMAELTALQVSGSSPSVAVSSVTLNPTSVTGGSSSQGIVMLTGPAPTGGALVTLSSGNTTAATMPATILVLAGATNATFTVSTSAVSVTTPVTISASYGGGTATAVLTVNAAGPISTSNWKLVYVDSQETQCENGAAVNGYDANSATIWHTQYCPSVSQLPHEIQIDMGIGNLITGFRYLPRQDGGIHGRIGQFEFYATNDLSNWGDPLVTGTFANDATLKQVPFTPNTYRYIRLRALTEANGGPWTSMAELSVF